jgi:hypothetical protein
MFIYNKNNTTIIALGRRRRQDGAPVALSHGKGDLYYQPQRIFLPVYPSQRSYGNQDSPG